MIEHRRYAAEVQPVLDGVLRPFGRSRSSECLLRAMIDRWAPLRGALLALGADETEMEWFSPARARTRGERRAHSRDCAIVMLRAGALAAHREDAECGWDDLLGAIAGSPESLAAQCLCGLLERDDAPAALLGALRDAG